jgi:hypothetical protein
MNLRYAKKIAKELEIPISLPEKRGRKRNIHHPGEEGSVLSAKLQFFLNIESNSNCSKLKKYS